MYNVVYTVGSVKRKCELIQVVVHERKLLEGDGG